jgi:hypothetical protein
MSEATAGILKNGQVELLRPAVDIIVPEGDGLRLVSTLGEPGWSGPIFAGST